MEIGINSKIDIREYYIKYGPMVLRRCRKLLVNEELAVQAMQDTFVKLMENEMKLNGTFPSSLLFRMSTNICLNIVRSKKNDVSDICGDDLISKIACSDDIEEKSLITNILNKLFDSEKETTRAMAVMHYVDEMTLEEVAHEVGMSVSGVRKRLRGLNVKALDLQEAINYAN